MRFCVLFSQQLMIMVLFALNFDDGKKRVSSKIKVEFTHTSAFKVANAKGLADNSREIGKLHFFLDDSCETTSLDSNGMTFFTLKW